MIVRALGLLLGLPALLLGAMSLASALMPEHSLGVAATDALESLAGATGSGLATRLSTQLASPIAAGILLLIGVALLSLVVGRWGHSDRADPAPDSPAPVLDRRQARKAERQAAALAKQGQLSEAGELCFGSGLLDAAAGHFERAGAFVRAAEIRHDQNRFAEAAQLYVRAGQHETAGTIFAAQNDYARAADCYSKAGRLSVAGEMFEKGGDFEQAGDCYEHCEFHRHAAQAFVRAQNWPRAAKALESVVLEEGHRVGAGQDPAKEQELHNLVLKAGKLYEQAGDPESAERVLEKGGCFGPAAEVALRLEHFELAADLFQRAGEAPRAAEALRQIGEEQAADQVLGEYHRERGDDDEAARLLAQAGDFGAAGDLYRLLEDFKMAGECYERQCDPAQAAEVYRLGGEPELAAANFERIGLFEEAAECADQLGDAARQAGYLARGGQLLRAGEIYAREGLDDDAIKVLQQVSGAGPEFTLAAALLGEIFRAKGKHTLAMKKLRQAIGDQELDASNIELFYALATVCEAAGQAQEAGDLYEKILAADYHYRDAEARLEAVRVTTPGSPASEGGIQGSTGEPPGRYEILGELGRGGMGIVYKAQDTVLDRPVAFKVLPDALRDSPQALKNFLREAKSAAKLNHPNIVTVYDAGEQDGRYYIAMEYVDGTTLKEIVRRRGAISAANVIYIMVQMCDALELAHRHKVVHRDIKTANTMWTRDRTAKIMDFGLAKVVEEVRNHTTLVSGTPYYMSPEQTLGRNVDQRTDIYSLGVTLYEMATGELPFKEGNVPYHHVHTPAPDPRQACAGLPNVLVEIVTRCLKKDPAERFQSAGEIASVGRAAIARASSSRQTSPGKSSV
jgi:tetratricopeptide (TPR) repeat protein